MLKSALALIVLASYGHARRVQTLESLSLEATRSSAETAQIRSGPEDVEQLKKEVADRRFKRIRAMEKRINKQMEAMMADPKLEEFNEYRRRIKDAKKLALMANPKFRDVQEQSTRIDDMVKELLAHPNFKEFDDKMQRIPDQLKEVLADTHFQEQRQIVTEQLNAIAAEPEIQELTQLVDEEMKDKKDDPNFQEIMASNANFQELTRITEGKIKAVMASNPHFQRGQELAGHIEEEMLSLNENPEFQKFLEQTKQINTEMEVMKAMPNFKQFEEQVNRINEEPTEELNEDPKFKKIQEKAKRIDYQMQKMLAEPNFEEYQQLVTQIAKYSQAQKETPLAHSVLQLDQRSRRSASNPAAALASLLPSRSQWDPTHASHPAALDWQRKLQQLRNTLDSVRVSFGNPALEAARKIRTSF